MTSDRLSWTSFLALVLMLGLSGDAGALANRVFVSARSGNDANACNTIATPCQTFAGAVTQLNPGGEAIVLDSGGYGTVTITQALTIEAPPGVLAFIHPPSGDGITINAGGSDTVVLRGLVLNGGSGNGITVNTVGALHVENSVINGFTGVGVTIGCGILFDPAGQTQLFVKDSVIRGNVNVGILVLAPNARASVDRCRLEANQFGLTVSSLASSAAVSVRDSVASGSTTRGFTASNGGELNIENCLVANNSEGIGAFSGATVRVSDTTVTDNGAGLNSSGAALLSRGNNTVEGNTVNGSFTGTYTAK